MTMAIQAFATARPLALRPSQQDALRCARRRAAAATRTTPRATRATLTSDSSTPPALDAHLSTPQSVDDLSAADRSRVLAVRAQMEFWFSASNLRRDWYLRRQMDPSGWLDPAAFLRFNRIKSLNASLRDIILACSFSDELEVSTPDPSFGDVEGQTRVRRSSSLPDFREWDEDELARSFLMKRIPPDSTVESIQELLKPLGCPSYTRVYRSRTDPSSTAALICFEDRATADSVFMTFGNDLRPELKGISLKRRNVSQSGAEIAVAGEPIPIAKPSLLVFEITNLPPDLEWKALYDQLGSLFLENGGIPIRFLLFDQGKTSCHVTVADNSSTRGLLKSLSEKGITIGDSACSVRVLEDIAEIKRYWVMASEYQAQRKARRAGRDSLLDPNSNEIMNRNPPGVIVRMEGLNEETSWQALKADLEEMGRLVYLSFDRRTASCFARFGSASEARAVSEALAGATAREICGTKVTAYVLYGEEEVEYWERAEKHRKNRERRQWEREEEGGEKQG